MKQLIIALTLLAPLALQGSSSGANANANANASASAASAPSGAYAAHASAHASAPASAADTKSRAAAAMGTKAEMLTDSKFLLLLDGDSARSEQQLVEAIRDGRVDIHRRMDKGNPIRCAVLVDNPTYLGAAAASLRNAPAERGIRYLNIMKGLLDAGASPHLAGTSRMMGADCSVFKVCVDALSIEGMLMLLAHGVNPLQLTSANCNVLHDIPQQNVGFVQDNPNEKLYNIVRVLVALGVDIHARNNTGYTPVEIAIANDLRIGYPLLLAGYLVEFGASPLIDSRFDALIQRKYGLVRNNFTIPRGMTSDEYRASVQNDLNAYHETFKRAMREQLVQLKVAISRAFDDHAGYHFMYQGDIPEIINAYVGRTLFPENDPRDALVATVMQWLKIGEPRRLAASAAQK